MKLGRLNHIGVATPSIEESIAYYRDVMGATKIREPFDLEEQGVKVCFVDTPGDPTESGPSFGTQIELIEPLSDASPIAGSRQGPAGGQHHLCYEVEDIEEARSWFEEKGKRILGPTRTARMARRSFPPPQGHDGPAHRDHGKPWKTTHWSN